MLKFTGGFLRFVSRWAGYSLLSSLLFSELHDSIISYGGSGGAVER